MRRAGGPEGGVSALHLVAEGAVGLTACRGLPREPRISRRPREPPPYHLTPFVTADEGRNMHLCTVAPFCPAPNTYMTQTPSYPTSASPTCISHGISPHSQTPPHLNARASRHAGHAIRSPLAPPPRQTTARPSHNPHRPARIHPHHPAYLTPLLLRAVHHHAPPRRHTIPPHTAIQLHIATHLYDAIPLHTATHLHDAIQLHAATHPDDAAHCHGVTHTSTWQHDVTRRPPPQYNMQPPRAFTPTTPPRLTTLRRTVTFIPTPPLPPHPPLGPPPTSLHGHCITSAFFRLGFLVPNLRAIISHDFLAVGRRECSPLWLHLVRSHAPLSPRSPAASNAPQPRPARISRLLH